MSTTQTADEEKKHAALNSLYCAALLTVLKLAAGLATNSLGILSEALHSGLDLLAAGITLFAVRMASRPADREHPYGYGKIENLSALAETVLLLITCGWIVHEAVARLFFEAPVVIPSFWGVGVIAVALFIDINRARMLRRVAKKHKSQALEADALHFSTDIWSSAVVLVGLLCVWAGSFFAPGSLVYRILHMGDAVAALLVSGIVVLVGLRMSGKAVNALLDGGGLVHTEKIEEILAQRFPGCAVIRLRVRESGADAFVDVTVEAPSDIKLDAAHDITKQIESAIQEIIASADVTVHVEPVSRGGSSVLMTAHAMAAAYGLTIHNLNLSRQSESGGLILFLHVEAPPQMCLSEAHQRVDAFEGALGQRLDARVVTHIEPEAQDGTAACQTLTATQERQLRETVASTLAEFPAISHVHGWCVYHLGGAPLLSFHCRVPAQLTVSEAHELASRFERAILQRCPELGRILIHTDPYPL